MALCAATLLDRGGGGSGGREWWGAGSGTQQSYSLHISALARELACRSEANEAGGMKGTYNGEGHRLLFFKWSTFLLASPKKSRLRDV